MLGKNKIWTNCDKIVLPISLLVILFIAFMLYFFLRKKSKKVKNIPLVIITIVILILEIIKQIKAIREGYDSWTIPLHFCSLFLYIFPLATLTKGEIRKFGIAMSFACSVIMTVMFYIGPASIIGAATTQNIFASFSSFHTFFYHHLVILFLVVGLLLNKFKLTKKSLFHVVVGFVIYSVVAVSFAHILNTNFCNILESNIAFMEDFRLKAGQIIYTIVMFLFGISASVAVCLINLGVYKLLERRKR